MQSSATNRTQSVPLIALRVSNGALASAPNLPTRLKLLEWGDNPSTKGPVKLGATSARVLAANQAQAGFAKVALDFEHNTVAGSAEYERTSEPRRVAAFGVPTLIPGDGLYLEHLEWTPAGKAEAFNFADLSPAVQRDDAGEVLFIHSAALTRNGAVEGLSFFSAVQTNPNKNPMPENISLEDLAAPLGLKATAMKAEILTALSAQCSLTNTLAALVKDGKIVALAAVEDRLKAVETKNPLTTLSATVDGKEVPVDLAKLVALSARVDAMETAHKTAATQAEETNRLAIVQRFSSEGKVPIGADGKALSDDVLKALPVVALSALLASTPSTVPLSARGKLGNDKQKRDDLKGLDRVTAAFKADREQRQ